MIDRKKRYGPSVLAGLALLAVPLLAYRAAFGGYFMLDDFGLLAIVRFFDSPIGPFHSDHIGGSLFYRPLGMAVWWLSQAAFGAQAPWHYLLNLVLHVGAGAALWRVIGHLGGGRWLGFGLALVFLVHPIGIGTSLWLSDRFDLLAALCGLIGLGAACRFRQSGTLRSRVAALAWLACALLAKEIALAYVAAVFVLWAIPSESMAWRHRVTGCSSLVMLTAVFLGLRALVLADPAAAGLIATQSIPDLLVRGLISWARGWVDFFSYWPAMGQAKQWGLGVGLGLLVIGVTGAAISPWDRRRLLALAVGMTLWWVPAFLQWPLTGHLSMVIQPQAEALKLVLDARYYYTAHAGFMLVLAALLAPTAGKRWRLRLVAALAFGLLTITWFSASQRLADRYRQATLAQGALAKAAVDAIAGLDLRASRCQIFLLGTESWMFSWVSDEAVKAVYPDLARIQACLIQTEHTPWYHLVARGSIDAAAAWPLMPLPPTDFRREIAWQTIGRGEMVYFNLSPAIDVGDLRHAHFLEYREGRFVDITEAVLDRRRPVQFICNRAPVQCP